MAPLSRGVMSVFCQRHQTTGSGAVSIFNFQLRLAHPPDERRALVLLTDGIIDMGDRQEDIATARWLRESLLPDARQAGVRIFAIAFSEAADYELLQNMAHETGGGYLRALGLEDSAAAFGSLERALSAPLAAPAAPAAPASAATPVAEPAPGQPVPAPAGEPEAPRYVLPAVGAALALGLAALLVALSSSGCPTHRRLPFFAIEPY